MHTKAMTTLDSSLQFASLTQGTQAIELEYQRIAPERETAPLLVFLHEGLGSIAMWKDWPAQLCEQTGCSGLMYSRYGYGRSTPRPDASAAVTRSRPTKRIVRLASQSPQGSELATTLSASPSSSPVRSAKSLKMMNIDPKFDP